MVTRLFQCVDQNSNAPLVAMFEVLIILELVCALDAKVVLARNATCTSPIGTMLVDITIHDNLKSKTKNQNRTPKGLFPRGWCHP
jgi:hypothetical protein